METKGVATKKEPSQHYELTLTLVTFSFLVPIWVIKNSHQWNKCSKMSVIELKVWL